MVVGDAAGERQNGDRGDDQCSLHALFDVTRAHGSSLGAVEDGRISPAQNRREHGTTTLCPRTFGPISTRFSAGRGCQAVVDEGPSRVRHLAGRSGAAGDRAVRRAGNPMDDAQPQHVEAGLRHAARARLPVHR